MKNILVALTILTDEQKRKIEEAAQGCAFRYVNHSDVSEEDIAWADIVFGNVPQDKLHEPDLELVQLISSGADAYAPEGILKRNTILCSATGAYNKSVSEHTLAMTLMLQKRLHLYRDNQKESLWKNRGTVQSIAGSVVLIIGLGEIGLAYAKLVKALGAYVIGIKRREGERPEYVDEMYTFDRTDSFIPRADIVVSILPGTEYTNGFFTEERFGLMKESAIFINVGRGNVVSTDVLCKVMRDNRIYAAGLDVFESEPLAEDCPLWNMENVMITPHCAGGFNLDETINNIVDICAGNLRAYLTGDSLSNIVDYETGYRK